MPLFFAIIFASRYICPLPLDAILPMLDAAQRYKDAPDGPLSPIRQPLAAPPADDARYFQIVSLLLSSLLLSLSPMLLYA